MTTIATSGFLSNVPVAEIFAAPSLAVTASEIARPIVWPLVKSAAVVSVPCQLIVQPPACIAMLSAPDPAIRTFAPLRIGRTLSSFLSSTSDFETASRARSRWSCLPTNDVWPRTVGVSPMRPSLYFTRNMRRTASSNRAFGIRPSRAAVNVEANNPFQLSGAMNRSSPALIAAAQSVAEQPATWPWPFQSPTTSPLKPIRCFNTSVRREALP